MIPPQVFDLLQTGVSVIVGTRDSSLMPDSTRAWGIHIATDRASVTIFHTEAISEDASELTGERLGGNQLHQADGACQLKGRLRTIRPAGQADWDHSRSWHRDFAAELVAIGVPPDRCEAWITEPALAIEIDVTDVFHQTPSPGAGEKV